ncbi:MAG: cupin domain-containing protein [Planctomycetota bacterium]|nr:cupin domain-containing protein [Planctomycetota bacterium]
MDANKIIEHFALEPLEGEGGFYRETYRSGEKIPAAALPGRYSSEKHFATAIYYLLTPETFSAIHRLVSDEIFHFYLGDPVTMLRLYPDGKGETVILGPDIEAGQRLQCVVPRGVWQGMFLNPGGQFALMGTTVAPAFDFDDYQTARRDDLIQKYPDFAKIIQRLTDA